jgi:N-glycosylase/DNA lyase
LWWEEFSKKIYEDFDILKETISNKNDNIKWRHSFLTNSKYNKRLYNLKTNRLKKFDVIKLDLSIFEDGFSFINHYNDMENLFEILKKTLNSD